MMAYLGHLSFQGCPEKSNNDHLEMGALGSFKIYFFSLPVTARLLVFTMLAGLVAFKATKMLGRTGGGINWPSQNATDSLLLKVSFPRINIP